MIPEVDADIELSTPENPSDAYGDGIIVLSTPENRTRTLTDRRRQQHCSKRARYREKKTPTLKVKT